MGSVFAVLATEHDRVNLRPYQDRAIAELRASYASGRRAPCLVLPTGAGKTVVAAEIIRSAVARGRRVLFLAHRVELLDQTVRKLGQAGVHDVRVIQAAIDLGNPQAPVAVASIPTLTSKRWSERVPKADLVIIDEAHHCKAPTYERLIQIYAEAHLLGLTATPQRADGKPLGDVFDALVVGSTVRELTALGHLVPCRVWAPHDVLEAGQIAMSPAEVYRQHANNERAVIFCVTVEHAERVAAEMPVATGVVHGQMAASARASVLDRFKRGELRAVANVHVLTEGWDDPAVAVCILTRKPQHAGTFLQMVGRVLRPAPGKTHAMLLDLGGSVWTHGTPDADRLFALDGKAISQVEREPIRQCPSCGAVFRAAAACPQCGAVLPIRAIKMPEAMGIGLSELPKLPPRPMRSIEIDSRFPGICSACRSMIHTGDRILWSKGEKPRHSSCGSTAALDEANALMRRVQ